MKTDNAPRGTLTQEEEERGQAVADKLARIWIPSDFQDDGRKWWIRSGPFVLKTRSSGPFFFQAKIGPTTRFLYEDVSWLRSSDLYANRGRTFRISSKTADDEWQIFYRSNENDLSVSQIRNRRTSSLTLDAVGGEFSTSLTNEPLQELRHLLDEWLPRVRRNAHLMGFAIDCTAHEQLEWHHWLEEKRLGPP